ncbi:hypothetical protein G6O69_02255 [Pseudenhygromyxa sp. WMMC2535]|uniref:hypothetical protein n=1 Tax=Pseudenhygromyxa sp. WMMC2535 TaxID=2712867 RepID=UPI00155322CE|nr:hypothetical protein [Pseudenhygromyxa sp. WMMC2535]NVB36637.1 hypothetical protein [Pseudenhygromyxa sp. WMMC2535]
MALVALGLAAGLLAATAPSALLGEGEGDGPRFSPPQIQPGWDMQEQWDEVWRRFQDRNGRPDAQGPLLQPSPELQRPEYELTLAQAQHPFILERDWNTRTRGARVFLNSDDELSFFNQVRIKERVPMGIATAGIRFDRTQVREVDSNIVRLNFAFPDIRGSGAFVEIRPIARFEKPDLDGELVVGWARPGLLRVAARAFFMDPANNASDALAQNRATPQEVRVLQKNLSLGLASELDLELIPHTRVQLFFGGLLPSRTRLSFADEARTPYVREQTAVLGGGWVEFSAPRAPVQVGVSGLGVQTGHVLRNDAGARLSSTPERELRARAYALAQLGAGTRGHTDIEASLALRRTLLPAHEFEYGSVTRDRSWLAQLRATWMPTRVFGLEIGYLILDRLAEGEPAEGKAVSELADYLTGTNHRLHTRLAFVFGPHVRFTFGVGWDLDDPTNRYDQGGFSLSMRW